MRGETRERERRGVKCRERALQGGGGSNKPSPLFYRGTAPVLNIPGPSPVTSSSEEEEDLEHDMEEEQEEEKEASRKRKRA